MSELRGKPWVLIAGLVILAGACREDMPLPPPGEGPPPLIEQKPDAGPEHRDGGVRFDGGWEPPADAGVEDAGVPDAGTPIGEDAGVDAGVPDPDAGTPLPHAGLIYSADRIQSPIDSALVQRLKDIAARGSGRAGVFARVGDSVSIAFDDGPSGSSFLNCFDGILEGPVSWDVNIRLGAYTALSPTIDYFKATPLSSNTTSWSRIGHATRIGMTASWPMSGNPSPINQELAAINPRYAVVLYGSNDIGWGGEDEYPVADQAERYERNMRRLTDHLIDRGVVPILNTMPPDGDFFWMTPVFSAVLRAIAQGRQVPLIDLYKALLDLGPPYGLRSDRTHPSQQDYNTCCWFDPASLSTYGANVRNLITLESFDRMRQIFDQGVPSLDPNAPRLVGDGSAASPFVIDQVPWGELRELKSSTFTATGSLSCAGAPPVAGPQVLYRLVLSRPMALRILVLDGGQGGQRVSLLSGPSLGTCVESDDRLVTARLAAGTYYVAVNALTPTGGTEYNLSISECVAGDSRCN